MPGDGGHLSPLEEAWREALADYTHEVKKTLELLTVPGGPDGSRLDAIERQRVVEQRAFEKFRRARRAFLGSILGGAGGLLIVVAANVMEWV